MAGRQANASHDKPIQMSTIVDTNFFLITVGEAMHTLFWATRKRLALLGAAAAAYTGPIAKIRGGSGEGTFMRSYSTSAVRVA